MPISPMDEYLAHQTTETFDYVFTSDRNFYDRYYFNMHDSKGDFFMVAGLGQYPNLGVTDAFAAISHGSKQYVVRASRALGSDRLDTSVGPFRVEVIEGLQSLRLRCDENEWGLSFDIRFDGAVPALEEPKTFVRNRSRVMQDVSRYCQVGHYTGSVTVAGQTYDVTPDHWQGARDRSWGVRPVGEREAPGIAIEDMKNNVHGFFHQWIPLQLDRGMYKVMLDRDYEGRMIVEEAAFIPSIGRPGGIRHFGTPEIEIDFISGTREMKSARTRMPALEPGGEDVTFTSTPLRTVYLAAGTGYIASEEWGHGHYKGPLVVQGETFDMSTQAQRSRYAMLNETLCRFDLSTGEVAYGMHENMCLGVYRPFGFDEPGKMAP
ncbi:MAG: hypothetical protein H6748_17990 [Spirochaetaceae bacterium]|nr:hypothetical protein [Myxococcales bacterium]MCB9725945.1 hypothetical protein [Spirochaetaceae bacterium]